MEKLLKLKIEESQLIRIEFPLMVGNKHKNIASVLLFLAMGRVVLIAQRLWLVDGGLVRLNIA